MLEDRNWLWPWEREPNWITGDKPKDKEEAPDPDDDDDDGPEEEEEPQKEKPPQFSIVDPEIVVPPEGIKPRQPYKVRGKIKRLGNEKLTSLTIYFKALQKYNENEEPDSNTLDSKIDPETDTFEVQFDGYNNPNTFDDDKNKPADATFDHYIEIDATGADNNPVRTPAIKLPMPTKDYIIKPGYYDQTWVDAKNNPDKFPASGDKFIPGDKIKKIQGYLIQMQFLPQKSDDGFYGDQTEQTIKEFQNIAMGQKRSKFKDGRIFLIAMNQITYKGTDDAIYGPETEKEIANWVQNNWIKPKIDLKLGDIDDNGALEDKGHKGADNHHEGDQVLDIQKLFKAIGAYTGKLDGWVGPKMEAAIKWVHECIEKCNFVDAAGQPVKLDVREQAKGYRPKHADEPTVKAVKVIIDQGAKVPKTDSGETYVMRDGKKVPFYYQLDETWKSEKLGENRTIGQAGCALSCLSMILKYYGRDVNPLNLDAYLDKHSGYAGDSVYFDTALQFAEGNGEKLSYNGNRVKSGFPLILDERIKNNLPTIARVKYGVTKSSTGDHFVVVVGKTADGKYIMNDPGSPDGNGAENFSPSNIIEDTTRKSGYSIIWIDCISSK